MCCWIDAASIKTSQAEKNKMPKSPGPGKHLRLSEPKRKKKKVPGLSAEDKKRVKTKRKKERVKEVEGGKIGLFLDTESVPSN